eukprot:GEMP01022778.1.p1 GENE.GEMP01022778.1~~GEMP01022778.1.p1  ORF type:complete len:498 (+),score=104.33 GEMP01022778.1:86-1579(+)
MHRWEDSFLGLFPPCRVCAVSLPNFGQFAIAQWLDVEDIQVQVANHLGNKNISFGDSKAALAMLQADTVRAISLHAHYGRADIITDQILPLVPYFLMLGGLPRLLGEIIIEALEKRRRGFTYAVRTLLECKADINTQHPRNKSSTALTTAAELGYAKVLRFLLDNGDATSGPSDKVLQHALRDAVVGSHRDVVNVLVSEFFDRYHKRVRGDRNKKLKFAHPRMADLLGCDIMSAAASQRDATIALNLLDADADADPCLRGQVRYPLTSAAKRGCLLVAEHLLSHGACINGGADCDSDEFSGMNLGLCRRTSPLYEAVFANHVEMVSMLLKKLADPELGAFGTTPLVEACGRGNEVLVDLLLRFRADVHANPRDVGHGSGNEDIDPDITVFSERRKGTKTPLHAACGGYWRFDSKSQQDAARQNIVRKLICAKADIWATDEFGVTSVVRAQQAGFHTIADIAQKEEAARIARSKKTHVWPAPLPVRGSRVGGMPYGCR